MTQPHDACAPAYSREHALRHPLELDTHDTGFRYLFDFTVAARALELRPGARVLDFASGPGFATELLNRLGYRTVAVDLDPPVLRIARDRLGLDARCEAAQAAFVGGDGQRLPFGEGSFDGILCMNALHHMPDYRVALAEMFRVLRPGGRAAFSEPGSLHSTSPESLRVIQEFGAVEKDVVLEEIHVLAREAGFERMVLKPFVYPEFVDLDVEDFARFSEGVCPPDSRLDPRALADLVHKTHVLFCLVKPGTAEPTSANAPPSLLQAGLDVRATGTGDQVSIAAVCRNSGRCTWVARPGPAGGNVTFGVRILDGTGRLVDDLRGRQPLPHDVRPGESVEVASCVPLAGLPPGRYRLVFDMVAERITWFGDVGSPTVPCDVEVPSP
jgi:ubiquinone/menaquinone biosynthesis C-methylase UbiE